MHDTTFQQRCSRNRATFRFYRNCSDVFDEFRRKTVNLRKKELSVYLSGDGGFFGIAKSSG